MMGTKMVMLALTIEMVALVMVARGGVGDVGAGDDDGDDDEAAAADDAVRTMVALTRVVRTMVALIIVVMMMAVPLRVVLTMVVLRMAVVQMVVVLVRVWHVGAGRRRRCPCHSRVGAVLATIRRVRYVYQGQRDAILNARLRHAPVCVTISALTRTRGHRWRTRSRSVQKMAIAQAASFGG